MLQHRLDDAVRALAVLDHADIASPQVHITAGGVWVFLQRIWAECSTGYICSCALRSKQEAEMGDSGQKFLAQVRKIIGDIVKAQLGREHVVSVTVEEDHDFDGDLVLRVTVVHKGDRNELDPSKLSGLLRHLRPALSKGGEGRFPVMSFVAAEERSELA